MQSAITAQTPPETARSYRLVDGDSHAYTPESLRTLTPYLTTAWRRRLEVKGFDLNFDALSYRYKRLENDASRVSAVDPQAISDPARFVSDWLGANGHGRAVISRAAALG